MTIETCATCLNYGTVCRTCGKGRLGNSKRHTRGPHRDCVGSGRGPDGCVIPCPTHAPTVARCDFCRTTATPKQLISGAHTYPSGWTRREDQLFACPACTAQLEIARDAIIDREPRAEDCAQAVAQLVRRLKNVTREFAKVLTEQQRTDVLAAIATAGRALRPAERPLIGAVVALASPETVRPAEGGDQALGVVVRVNDDRTVDVSMGGDRITRFRTEVP